MLTRAQCPRLLITLSCSDRKDHAARIPVHVLVLRLGGPAGGRRGALHAGGAPARGPPRRERGHHAVVPDDLGLPLQGAHDGRGVEVNFGFEIS